VGLRKCGVSYCDPNGVEHTVEVTVDSLYEAVAQGLRVFRDNDWINEVEGGRTVISVAVTYQRFSTRFAFRILNGGSNRKGGLLLR
jgi:hypothetical protein